VITQFHTSIMFSKRCVGAANAAAAGWGNLGGGVTQLVMPLLVGGLMFCGMTSFWAWRGAMFAAGVACLVVGIAYYLLTQDAPDGDFKQLRAAGMLPRRKPELAGVWAACRNPYVWTLFVAYGACFGLELTMDNIAAIYFFDRFHLSPQSAGMIAATFGAMNLFARFLGGWIADRFGSFGGLRARIGWLAAVLLGEGIALVCFGQIGSVALAIPMLLAVGLCVKMANGATYAVVPLVHQGNLGAVAGIVGAGGNVGAVAAGYLFRAPTEQWPTVLQNLGMLVALSAFIPLVMAIRERTDTTAAPEAVALDPA
jgi:NNP family nitrate/nitrite transporter-like MFS transporter